MGNTKLLVITVRLQLHVAITGIIFLQWVLISFHGENIKVLRVCVCIKNVHKYYKRL